MDAQVFELKGILRDTAPTRFPATHALDIRNLRINTNGEGTLLSLSSEKGNRQYATDLDIHGKCIGYCVINDYIVLFNTEYSENVHVKDYIYRCEEVTPNELTVVLLYEGDLNFSKDVVLETKGVYENKQLQKVYWIDGINQPRMINIVEEPSKYMNRNNPFDFVPSLKFKEKSSVTKVDMTGMFPSGTIQYMACYFNNNGQQSAIFYQSPLYYLTDKIKGLSPEDVSSDSFEINIENIDKDFDYIRIYSVLRTSENGTPVCKKVVDLPTKDAQTVTNTVDRYNITFDGNMTLVSSYSANFGSLVILNTALEEVPVDDFFSIKYETTKIYSIPNDHYLFNPEAGVIMRSKMNRALTISVSGTTANVSSTGETIDGDTFSQWQCTFTEPTKILRNHFKVSVIDNGLYGEIVDYSEILYAGGSVIFPKTMASKDNTLFFGNYRITQPLTQEMKDTVKEGTTVTFGYTDHSVSKGSLGSYYMHGFQLNQSSKDITTFKGGESYNFGIVLQDDKGQWTDVIPLGSHYNRLYPKDETTCFYPVKAYLRFTPTVRNLITKYKRVMAVMLDAPSSVVAQGVLCPTVYNKNRATNSPYAMSSWFFRTPTSTTLTNHKAQALHDGNIRSGGTTHENVGEVQGAKSTNINYYDTSTTLTDMDFFVDWNTVTLNSPDLEFGDVSLLDYRMRIVGAVPIEGSRSSMHLTWSTPPYHTGIENFKYTYLNYPIPSTNGSFMELATYQFKDYKPNSTNTDCFYPIYPWHRNGSLTSQATPSGTEAWKAMLGTKTLANLRTSSGSIFLDPIKFVNYDITGLQVYHDDSAPISLKADPKNARYTSNKQYLACVDMALTTTASYNTYYRGSNGPVIHISTNEPVRMKYKSGTHGVFSLKCDGNYMPTLPNISSSAATQSGELYKILDDLALVYVVEDITYEQVGKAYRFDIIDDFQSLRTGDLVILKETGLLTDFNNYVYRVVRGETKIDFFKFDRIAYESYGDDVFGFEFGSGWGGTPEDPVFFEYKFYFRYVINDTETIYSVLYDTWDNTATQPQLEYTRRKPTGATLFVPSITFNTNKDYIFLAELYSEKTNVVDYSTRPWKVAGEAYPTDKLCIVADYGDTFYQRYDCLKTYPYSLDDQNQIVEVLSFMCETKVNIDGRYDNNRGLADNTLLSPTIFNLTNRGYSQVDNFKTYSYLDSELYGLSDFPTQITWSKTKSYGAKFDNWLHYSLLSTLDLDGTLGGINALRLFKENLVCFQDKGVVVINYNDKVALTTNQGVPIELSNSGKVNGHTYVSSIIGCKNKDSIFITDGGMYFLDTDNKSFMKFADSIENVSMVQGLTSFFSDENLELDKLKTFYDPIRKDLYLKCTYKDKESDCLLFNEQLNSFTGFMDYDLDYLINYNSSMVSVKDNAVYKQFEGDYLNFFGEDKGYSLELISAKNPNVEKIFTNLNIQSTTLPMAGDTNEPPFDKVRVSNDYQDSGNVDYVKTVRRGTNMSQKFRLWRTDIPRNGVLERIRNPWTKIKLTKNPGKFNTNIDFITVVYY